MSGAEGISAPQARWPEFTLLYGSDVMMSSTSTYIVHDPEASPPVKRPERRREVGTMRRIKRFSKNPGSFHFITSDSQSCSTTSAELSPGVIEGITKRLPSAETSNETTEWMARASTSMVNSGSG